MDMLASVVSLIGQVEEQIGLDSLVLGEIFYFFTVVVMWLIHAGFMMYEAGAAQRKNIMSTAMKNILTIAVVTPTFYYFGWYIYGCFQHGGPAEGHAGPAEFPGFCGATAPWADQAGPNLADHISLVFFLAFLLFSWTTGSIMSGALIERDSPVRLPPADGAARARRSGSWMPPGAGAPAAGSSRTTASTTRSHRWSCTASQARSRSACS